MKKQRGITLIALVITIIVLLILAGVTISMVAGDNGILSRADDSKSKTERAKIVELARLDVGGQQGENLSSKLRKSELIDILNKYFSNVSEIENSSNILEETVTSKEEYGIYDIKVKEIYNNGFLDDENSTVSINDLSCDITASNLTPTAGQEVKFTIKISNSGGKTVAVSAVCVLDTNLEFSKIEGLNAEEINTNNNGLNCNNISIPAYSSREVSIFTKVSNSCLTGTEISNAAIISFDGENISDSVSISIVERTSTVEHKVIWYGEYGEELRIENRVAGYVGTKVEVSSSDKFYPGYTFDESNSNNVLEMILTENEEENVLKMYFKINS